jgi:hypothetical protein
MPVLSLINPAYILSTYFFKINLIIIVPSKTNKTFKWTILFKFSNWNVLLGAERT